MNRRVFAASVGEVSMATVVMVVVAAAAAAAAAAASRHRTVRGTNSTHHFILTGLSINQSINHSHNHNHLLSQATVTPTHSS
jgi:hypothetical protein